MTTKNTAMEIAKEIIANTHGLDKAQSVLELNSQGITGELLREVYEILDKSNFVVDTALSDAFSKIVTENIAECKEVLKYAEVPGVRAELNLLEAKPVIVLGIQMDRNSSRYVEADTGIPLFVNRYRKKDKRLIAALEDMRGYAVLLDGDLVYVDRSGGNHKNLQ
jgi:hypothetical protein